MLRLRMVFRILVTLGVAAAVTAEPRNTRGTVLVLITDQPGRPFARQILEGIQDSLKDRIETTTYIEFLGPNALRSPEAAEAREKLIATQYEKERIDIVVALGDDALPVASRLRQTRFPSSHLFFGVVAKTSIPKDLTHAEGFWVDLNPLPAVVFALERMPAVSRLFLVGGTAPADIAVREHFRASIPQLPRPIEVTFLTGLTLRELRETARTLTRNDLVALTSNLADRSGRASNHLEQAQEISAVSPAPLVETSDISLGFGSIGGDVVSFRLMGDNLGRRIRQSFDQATVAPGVVLEAAPRRKAVDWRQLKRFGISESSIPADYEVLYRQPSFWEQHHYKVLGSAAVLVVQALLISFLLAERKRRSLSQARIEKQLELEAAITKVAAQIAQTNRGDLDGHLNLVSRDLAEVLGIDRVVIWLEELDGFAAGTYHAWPPSMPAAMRPLGLEKLPYISGELRSGREVILSTRDDLPRGTNPDRAELVSAGVASLLILPLEAKQSRIGALALVSRRAIEWRSEIISTIRIAASVIAQAISRVNSEERERRSEEDTSAVIASFPGFVAIVNEEGTILRLGNQMGFGKQCPGILRGAAAGDNLLALWSSEPNGSVVAQELQAVLHGRSTAIVEHRYEGEKGTRWIEVRAQRVSHSERGAIVSHLDVTDRKAIESENAANRETLWHLNRVASLGELSASLAHEINQPLAGIMNSAEAAAMLLDQPEPDLAEAREAIQDIINDDQRAGEIIHKMRVMLRRKHPATDAIDVNVTVKDTVRLLINEARLKHVRIDATFGPGIPLAAAGPVQLQQVLVNLITNAIEAVQLMPAEHRIIGVETGFQAEMNAPFVEVRDAGPGIPDEILAEVFEPFVTTKEKGLGLGLSICRSIIESIGGNITAKNAPGGGAQFRFSLRSHTIAAGSASDSSQAAAAG